MYARLKLDTKKFNKRQLPVTSCSALVLNGELHSLWMVTPPTLNVASPFGALTSQTGAPASLESTHILDTKAQIVLIKIFCSCLSLRFKHLLKLIRVCVHHIIFAQVPIKSIFSILTVSNESSLNGTNSRRSK